MKDLPEEVILEILLRLPVKSLLRFRSVSKSWLSLISNPQFAKSHFERSSMHTDKLIFMVANEARSIDFEAPFSNDSFVVRLNFPFTAPSNPIGIMGSCRGFVLLLDGDENLFVWNPSTGVCKRLWCSLMTYCVYGFGYDSSTDDYLVVLGVQSVHFPDLVTGFRFLSLKNNSWKEIEGTNFPYLSGPERGILLNGAFHWMVHRPNGSAVILAFNLIEKNLKELPMPAGFENYMAFDDFTALGGCLSLSTVNAGTTEIWVMKEYEVKSSWAKSITLSTEEIGTHYFSPICFTRGGDIVGTDGNAELIKFSREGELLEQGACCQDVYKYELADVAV